ncbi:PDZ domain-containing protein [Paenibacillus thermoaerophilus]|uniref:PDZ domain-containing protein n=1 Tax=Paenibacillus thermoaerophilus TaxID=1215385 RepID=A0ABW2V1X9_9BACL|nr:PDZ domain-containing protein [Paenibacillus thermoaerophilus]TMV19173.1 PDZ domain-containing protein [Paenibacillus thermoaerophilus]
MDEYRRERRLRSRCLFFAPEQSSPTGRRSKLFLFAGLFAATFAVLTAVSRIPVPLYAYAPGEAASVEPFVRMGTEQEQEQDQDQDQGQEHRGASIRMLTVKLSELTVAGALREWLDPVAEVRTKRQVFGEETVREYGGRMLVLMKGAQHDAIRAAYRQLGIPFGERILGVYVQEVQPGSPWREHILPGDRLVAVDGKPVEDLASLESAWTEGSAGAGGIPEPRTKRRIELERFTEGVRTNLVAEAELPPGDDGRKWQASGLVATELRELAADDPALQIRIDVKEVGGPSAGLPFALEAYARLGGTLGETSPDDVIAATGTIDERGAVCPVGGIPQKLEAAALAGAKLVLVPADRPAGSCGLSFATANGTEARELANKRHEGMEVRPVATFEEAIAAVREWNSLR